MEKQKLIEDFFKQMNKITKIDNPLLQMQEWVNLQNHLASIYDAGFKAGRKSGLKEGMSLRSN